MMTHFPNQSQPMALVTGATSQIGYFLLPRLQAAGFSVIAISRRAQSSSPNMVWQSLDLLTNVDPLNSLKISDSPATWVLFHLAPLPLLPSLLNRLVDRVELTRVMAFSSTSRFTKINSTDAKEQAIALALQTAEEAMITTCQTHQLIWTLFRPTLIYGCGKDKNVTFIAQFIRRFGFFPLLGHGHGLRQPVHAADLANACVQAYFSPQTNNQAYNLSGGETLTYRQMVATIFQQLGKSPRIVTIPLPWFKIFLHSIAWLPNFKHLSTAMLTRMNQDLCFDHTLATQDFGYQPRNFVDNRHNLEEL